MSCPNCGRYRGCHCTWDDIQRACRILRAEEREFNRKIGRPNVIDREKRGGKRVY